MASYSSADVKCPFYVSDDPKTCKLTCEGVPPGSTIACHFLNGKAMRVQIRKYCACDYQLCPWARLLFKGKYGE